MLPYLRTTVRFVVGFAFVAVIAAKFETIVRNEERQCEIVVELVNKRLLVQPHGIISMPPNQGAEAVQLVKRVATIIGDDPDHIFVNKQNIGCCFWVEVSGRMLPSGKPGYYIHIDGYGAIIATNVEQLKLAVNELERSMVRAGERRFAWKGSFSSEGNRLEKHRRFASLMGIGEPL